MKTKEAKSYKSIKATTPISAGDGNSRPSIVGNTNIRVASKSTATHIAAIKITKYSKALDYLKDR